MIRKSVVFLLFNNIFFLYFNCNLDKLFLFKVVFAKKCSIIKISPYSLLYYDIFMIYLK